MVAGAGHERGGNPGAGHLDRPVRFPRRQRRLRGVRPVHQAVDAGDRLGRRPAGPAGPVQGLPHLHRGRGAAGRAACRAQLGAGPHIGDARLSHLRGAGRRGRGLFRARRDRFHRHRQRHAGLRAGRIPEGRLHHHPAGGQEQHRGQRAHHPAQDTGGAVRHRDGTALHQAGDTGVLPEFGLFRVVGLRGEGGGARILRQGAGRSDHRRVGGHGGNHPQPLPLRPEAPAGTHP